MVELQLRAELDDSTLAVDAIEGARLARYPSDWVGLKVEFGCVDGSRVALEEAAFEFGSGESKAPPAAPSASGE